MDYLPHANKCLIKRVYTDSHYDVWIVKMEDMLTETYGIVNSETGVIENLQPNLFNAKALAKQFSLWLREPDEEYDFSKVLRGPDAPIN